MLKILLTIFSPPVADETQADWRRDPLSHPALRAMDQRELADLPIEHAPTRPSLSKAGEVGCCA